MFYITNTNICLTPPFQNMGMGASDGVTPSNIFLIKKAPYTQYA